MKYWEYDFTLTPASSDYEDVLEAVLAEAGFDSFEKSEDTGGAMKAYVKADALDESALADGLAHFPVAGVHISHTRRAAEDKDWNEEWERHYFQPLVVDGRCVVKATFHTDAPTAEYTILINPKMSFGTGHHATTRQMLHEILEAPLAGTDVLDMGCGTGILGILAALRGARRVLGIDVDEWCVRNARENCGLNGVENMDVELGDAALLPRLGPFDVVLANIHLNVIVRDVAAYASRLKAGGLLLTSGFYTADLPQIKAAAAQAGLSFDHAGEENGWCCAAFRH